MPSSEIDVLDLFNRAAREITGKHYPGVTYKSSIAELGIDSVASAEIVAKIEDELRIRISDEDFERIRTVQDIADTVNALVKK